MKQRESLKVYSCSHRAMLGDQLLMLHRIRIVRSDKDNGGRFVKYVTKKIFNFILLKIFAP